MLVLRAEIQFGFETLALLGRGSVGVQTLNGKNFEVIGFNLVDDTGAASSHYLKRSIDF